MNFFLEYLKIRKESIIEEKNEKTENDENKYSMLTDEQIKIYSINL